MKKSYWSDSNQIFFSPKLSLQGKNMLPQIVDLYIPSQQSAQQQQNFLTVFKKPIVNVYDRITHTYTNSQNVNYFRKNQEKKQKKPVCVVGQTKQFQKRTYTTNHKKRNITADYQMIQKQKIKQGCEEIIMLRNYRQTINQVASVPKKIKKSQKKLYNPQKPSQNSQYYYFIGQGNNSQLIQQIMKRRMNWEQTNSSIFHFRWQQARAKYHNMQTINKQLLNHLPNHQAISDKCSLVKNLKVFCQKNEQQLFKIIPVCFEFNFGDLDLCQVQIKRFLQFYWQNNDKNGRYGLDMKQVKQVEVENDNDEIKNIGRSSSMNKKKQQQTVCQSPKKSINSKRQSTRSSHNKNFRSHKKQINVFNQTETLKKKQQIKILHRSLLTKIKTFYLFQDMSNLKKQNPFLAPIQSQIYGNTSLWLMKPADLNRGRGIHLFRTIDQLGDLLKSQLSHHQKSSYIIQKYIQKPLLIDNRKFDIRIFAMITHNRQLFLFKEGYIRTSSTPYDLHSKSYFSHLTNNAIQKNSKKYGQYQQGNILQLNYLFQNKLVKKQGFFQEIKKLVRISMRSGYDKIFTYQDNVKQNNSLISNFSSFQTPNVNKDMNRIKNFQIFGYDFMLDINGHLWIIEINTNPSIQLSSKWLKSIIPRMLDDAFKLTIDKIFSKGRQIKQNVNIHYPVNGYSNNQNLWEFIELKSQLQSSGTLL